MPIAKSEIDVTNVELEYVKLANHIGAIDKYGQLYILWWQPFYRGVISTYESKQYKDVKYTKLNLNHIISISAVAESCKINPEYALHIKAALEQLANDLI